MGIESRKMWLECKVYREGEGRDWGRNITSGSITERVYYDAKKFELYSLLNEESSRFEQINGMVTVVLKEDNLRQHEQWIEKDPGEKAF